jgi:predicted alpha/beta-fold hydrolase
MATSPDGRHYPWYRDAVWCEEFGNGEIIDVDREEIVVVFHWWTGTLDNKIQHRIMCVIEKHVFETCWCHLAGCGYWRLEGYTG